MIIQSGGQHYVYEDLHVSPDDVRQEGVGLAGRFDSMFGRVIIEYKRPRLLDSPAEREAAARQALDYLEDPTFGAQVVIVTDGQTWGFLRDADAGPEEGEQGWLTFALPIARSPAERFAWHPNSEEAAHRVLQLLSTLRSAPVNASNVASRLGLTRPEVRILVGRLADGLHARTAEDRTDVLFRQWIQLAGVAYGIEQPNEPYPESSSRLLGEILNPLLGHLSYPEAIFVLHTYVGLAAKLVASEVLALVANRPEERPSGWVGATNDFLIHKLNEIETGRLTEYLRAPGLIGGDVFGWYAPQLASDRNLTDAIRGVLTAISELAWARIANAGSVALDLLRHLYHEIVPRGIRKALGEFFTPRWLAERVLLNSFELLGDISRPRILDPSCGSGTFLVAALSRELAILETNDSANEEALADLTHRIIGFDINPVSALMTRVNLLLALGDC